MRSIVTTVMVGLALVSCSQQAQDETRPNTSAIDVPAKPQDRCVVASTVQQLKSMTFKAARRLSSSDPVRMNDLERQSVATLEMPLLVSHDDALDRTVCSGRLRIEVPVGAQAIFGPDELLADMTYSMQPAADGSGLVFQVDSFGTIPATIGYADLSRFNQSRAISAPQGTPIAAAPTPEQNRSSGSASFDCRLARTAVERMICADPALGELDRQMATAYSARRRSHPGSGSEQVAWISARNKCTDPACLFEAYEYRIAQLAK